MKLTADDLYEFGIIDKVISEEGDMYASLKDDIVSGINELGGLDNDSLLERRYMKFRKIEGFKEKEEENA